MCGADGIRRWYSGDASGSPPRVRSRLFDERAFGLFGGITSACAEQTDMEIVRSLEPWDHLRVCGADGFFERFVSQDMGSPPRVRSRQGGRIRYYRHAGITSACAEQTAGSTAFAAPARDHLRVCGADEFPARYHAW